MSELSLQALRRTFYYDEVTGTLYRYRKGGMLRRVKIPAGRPNKGCWTVSCEGKMIPTTHVVIWLCYGEKPRRVTHINGNWRDLRLCNLNSLPRRVTLFGSPVVVHFP